MGAFPTITNPPTLESLRREQPLLYETLRHMLGQMRMMASYIQSTRSATFAVGGQAMGCNRTSLLAGISLVLIVACNDGDDPVSPRTPTPIPPACANIGGSWNAAFSSSCRGSDAGPASITQTGCSFSLTIVGSRSSLTLAGGTIQGNRVTLNNDLAYPCEGRIAGIGDVAGGGRSLTVNYNGSVTYNWGGCVCAVGPISGTFTLTR
jgi:hypothetical protein